MHRKEGFVLTGAVGPPAGSCMELALDVSKSQIVIVFPKVQRGEVGSASHLRCLRIAVRPMIVIVTRQDV